MRRFLVIVFLLLILTPVVFVAAALENRARVTLDRKATADDAQRARALFREFRALTEIIDGDRDFSASESDLQSAMRFAARAVPAARGEARISDGIVSLATSISLPLDLWLNIATDFGGSDKGIRIVRFKFGRFNLPPDLVVAVARTSLNLMLGDNLGTVTFSSVENTRIRGKTLVATVAMTRDQRKALAKSAKGKARSASGISSEEDVRRYWLILNDAVRNGSLPKKGSFTDYPIYVIRKALDNAADDGSTKKEVEAALLALAIYCGHVKFQQLVGDIIPERFRKTKSGCVTTTLADRGDLRQHFTVSMGLRVASNAGVAIAVGEFKELLDSGDGGSGFSFDDIAANFSGIRFADFFQSADPASAENALLAMRSEKAFFPTISDLPSFMPQAEFEERFGSIDSKAYKGMLRQIETRIDRLAIYAQ